MRESWQNYELDLINYQNKCRLIRGWDDLFNKVKEHINSVAAMKLSPYYKVNISKSLCSLTSYIPDIFFMVIISIKYFHIKIVYILNCLMGTGSLSSSEP